MSDSTLGQRLKTWARSSYHTVPRLDARDDADAYSSAAAQGDAAQTLLGRLRRQPLQPGAHEPAPAKSRADSVDSTPSAQSLRRLSSTQGSTMSSGDSDLDDRFRWEAGERHEFGVGGKVLREPVHGEFIIKGKLGVKKYMFVPPGMLSDPVFLDRVLKQWKLKRPNLVVELSDSTSNPLSHVQELDFQTSADFAHFREFQAGHHGAPASEGSQPFTLEQVNHIFHDKLVDTMGRVATTADANNSWFFYRCSNAGSGMVLEEGMEQTHATPVVLVVADPSGKHHRPASGLSVETLWQGRPKSRQMTAQLLRAAKPLRKPCVPTVLDAAREDFVVAMRPQDTWYCSQRWTELKERLAADDWSMWDSTPKKFENEFDTVFPLWMTTCGTHYIFTTDVEDFNPNCLAPTGVMICGGESEEAIFHAIQRARPTVALSHTYGVGGTFARIIDILKNTPDLHSLNEKEKAALAVKVFDNKDVSSEHQNFTSLSSIVRIIEAVISKPSLFESTIVTANPMVEDAEQTLSKLATCLASVGMQKSEAGAALSDQNATYSALRSYKVLSSNCEAQGRRSAVLIAFSLTFSFLSTLAAVVLTVLDGAKDPPFLAFQGRDRWIWVAQWFAILVPALSTLLSSIILTMNFSGKWATMKMASAQVVAQILLFRGQVGEYDIAGMRRARLKDDEGTDCADLARDNDSVLAHRARSLFAAEVQSIMQRVQDSDVGNDHLNDEEPDLEGARPKADSDARTLHASSNASRGARDAPAALSSIEDACCQDMSTEGYVSIRVRPMLAWAQRESRWVFRFHFWLRVAVVVVSSSTTVVVALGLARWAPVAVALSATLAAVGHNMNYAARLNGLNQLSTTLRNSLMFWDSLTIVEKRMPHVRTRMICTTEQALLAMMSAWTGGLASVDPQLKSEAAAQEPSVQESGREGKRGGGAGGGGSGES